MTTMVTISNNGSFGADHQTNTITEEQPTAKVKKVCSCGNVVAESASTCPQCFGQLNESTSKPLLLD
jgi:hypothetical protein